MAESKNRIHYPKTDAGDLQFIKRTIVELKVDSLEGKKVDKAKFAHLGLVAARIYPEDRHEFDSILGMSGFLNRLGWFRSEVIDPVLEHEESHYNAAKELGYKPNLEVWLLDYFGLGPTFLASVTVGKVSSLEDHIKILTAPKVLSPGDIADLAAFKRLQTS